MQCIFMKMKKCESPEFLSAGDHHGLKPNGSFSGDFKPIHVKNEVSKYAGKLKKSLAK